MAYDITSDWLWLLDHNRRILYQYLYRGQLYVYHKLNSFAQVCDKYFSRETLTFWFIAVTLLWSIIYSFYARIISVILKKMALPALQRSRLTKSLWHCGFYISSIILCIIKMIMYESQMKNSFEFYSKNIFVGEEIIPAHLLFSCIVIFAFFMQSLILTSIQKGLEMEFFEKSLFMTLLYTSYKLRYICLMLTVLLLIGISSVSIELMKITYCLNRGRIVKSSFLRNFTCLIFGIHCILWGGIFMYIIPKYYLMPSVNVEVPDKDVRTLCLLCGVLWSYFCMELYRAPITKLIWYCLWPDHSYGRRDWLDYVLFPPRNDVIEHLKQIRSKMQSQQAKSVQTREQQNENNLQKNKNSVALYQTVKCVMALKKRIRRKREAEEKANANDVGSASDVGNNESLD